MAYGDQNGQLGTAYMHIAWTLAQTLEEQNSNVRVTGEMDYPVWSGSLFNGRHNVVGSVISNCTNVDGPDYVPPNQEIHSPTPYCTLGDNKNYDHNMASQFSWQDSHIGGYFYMYAKSIVSHSPVVPASQYDFDSVDSLPLQAYGGGYDG